MDDRPITEVQHAAIVRDISGGMDWATAAQKYHISKLHISKIMRLELDRLRANGKPVQIPAIAGEVVGADEGVFAGRERMFGGEASASADDDAPPWDDDAEGRPRTAPRQRTRRTRQQFSDDPQAGEQGPSAGNAAGGGGRGRNNGGRGPAIAPDGIYGAGESRHGLPRTRYGPDQRQNLLDRTFEAYSDLLDERTAEGGMNAKELQIMAEVFKLLDTQARLGEGASTEHVQMSDNRDVVKAQIEQIRARRSAPPPPPPPGGPSAPTQNEVVA